MKMTKYRFTIDILHAIHSWLASTLNKHSINSNPIITLCQNKGLETSHIKTFGEKRPNAVNVTENTLIVGWDILFWSIYIRLTVNVKNDMAQIYTVCADFKKEEEKKKQIQKQKLWFEQCCWNFIVIDKNKSVCIYNVDRALMGKNFE